MYKLIIFAFLFLITFSCAPEKIDVDNLNDNKILVLGHGGMGTGISLYSINTYESISKCISLGADGSEIDIQLTKDSVLVAFHDEKLDGSTNLSGSINDYNWDELKAAYYTLIPFLKYPIITLDDLFYRLPNINEHYFSLDIKLHNGEEDSKAYRKRFSNAIVRLLNKYDIENTVFIESSNSAFLGQLKDLNPNYKLFIYPPSFEVGHKIAKEMKLSGITISTKIITSEQVKIAHDDSLFIILWGVNSWSKNKEAILKNPDIIQTDRLENMIRLLK